MNRRGEVWLDPILAPEERSLAGRVCGALYVMGGLTLATFVLLPGVPHNHRLALFLIAAGAALWGLLCLRVVAWDAAPRWLLQLSTAGGLGLIAGAVASSGGAQSPAWVYLFFVAVFAAYFYVRRFAYAYLVVCGALQAVPLLYDGRALHDGFLGTLVIAVSAYIVLGSAIVAGKQRMVAERARAEALAAEQSGLRRVATAVVDGRSAEEIYELVAIELATLLRAGAAGLMRFDSPEAATVVGSWADRLGGRYPPGTVVPVRPGGDVERARDSGRPVRIDDHPGGSPVERLGYSSSIVTPVKVAGHVWGVLAATAMGPFSEEAEQRSMAFGDLLATAIVSLEDRAKLAAQASSDPLTGLANHRILQQALATELARAVRHDRPLSVALIDVDNFKQVNDNGGHEAGDEMLVRIASCLRRLARAEDTLGRVGGDEFAWILPETSREQALIAVERARQMIASHASTVYPVSVSAGICDSAVTEDPGELMRLADGALYWSKAHGRNQTWIYDPTVVNELSAEQRAQRLERSHALLGLRALARAIDAKDPATRRHSERVAELAGRLARVLDWPEDQASLLREAALVHDVGKIGVPDELLRKPGPLTPSERQRVTGHAELSARIVEDVLAPDQVEWIRTHHERPDGEGYPDGLTAEEIPEGAGLLALADAWDVMTVSRPYSLPKTVEQALEECVGLSGRQFAPVAVEALRALHDAGDLALAPVLEDDVSAAQLAAREWAVRVEADPA